jgi:hypothetical protein
VALHTAYGYAAVLSMCTLILAILHHLYFYHVQCAGMRLRVAMCHMIYRKVSDLACRTCPSSEVSHKLESCNELGVMAHARTRRNRKREDHKFKALSDHLTKPGHKNQLFEPHTRCLLFGLGFRIYCCYYLFCKLSLL